MSSFPEKLARLAKRLGGLARDSGGSVVVEFALIGPVMLTMLFGVMEFGRYTYVQAAVNLAAQETTRYAVVNAATVTNEDLATYAGAELGGLDENPVVICVHTPPDTTETTVVSITIDYPYDPWFPLPFEGLTVVGSSEGFVTFSPLLSVDEFTAECPEATP